MERAECSLKETSEKDLTEDGDKGEGDMEIVKVPMTSKADGMSVEYGNVASVRVFSVNGDHQADLYVRYKETEDPDILLCDSSLSHVTSLRVSFCKHGFS